MGVEWSAQDRAASRRALDRVRERVGLERGRRATEHERAAVAVMEKIRGAADPTVVQALLGLDELTLHRIRKGLER